MGYRQALSFLLAAGLASAANSESEDVLKRVAAKVTASLDSIQSYTCVETIQRDYYRPRAATLPRDCPVLLKQRQHPTFDMALLLWARDRLRLEVATSRRGEINSWPGASRFSDSGIDKLVRVGPIGTGAFGALLSVIFVSDVRKFGTAGEATVDGRRCFIYSFAVPASASHFRMRSQDDSSWLVIGYEGLLYVDTQTADPVQLTVVTNDLPPAAGTCQTGSSLHFSRAAVDGHDLFLPTMASQQFVATNGSETRNTTTFSNCRQYFSESTITYYEASDDAAYDKPAASQAPPPDIPEWLPFSMELLTPLDSDTTAAGDRFFARLASPLRDGKRQIAPKGALIEGRVSQVELEFHSARTTFGLTPESIQIRGKKVPFAARLDLAPQIVALQERKRKGLQFFLPPPGEYAHYFSLAGTHALLPKGFLSQWLTAIPRGSRQP